MALKPKTLARPPQSGPNRPTALGKKDAGEDAGTTVEERIPAEHAIRERWQPGVALNLFAFGEEGFNLAVVCFVTQAVLTNTMAVYFASRSNSNALGSIANVLRMPLLYAALLALAVNLSGATVPTYLLKPVKLAGDAAVPLMLLLLGLQLSRTSLAGQVGYVGLAAVVRLLLAPALAYGLPGTLVLAGLTRKVAILQASMPTGVMTGLLAVEFDARPDLVTGVIFTSTLLSVGTLTVLISLLR